MMMGNRKIGFSSYATINLNVLRRQPEYKLPPTYSLGDPGNGCFLDAPGYPTYFTQSVYTQYGNNPPYRKNGRAPDYVIRDPETGKLHGLWHEWNDEGTRRYESLLRRLWRPLPEEHTRVQLWEQCVYAYMANCYNDPEERGGSHLIWPIPDWKLNSVIPDPMHIVGYSHEYREKQVALIEQQRQNYIESKRPLAVPENHSAVRLIRRFYPEHQPNLAWIAEPPTWGKQSDWWETQMHEPVEVQS